MEKYWILVDIDGTLSDASKRAEMYLNGDTPDWDGFYAACGTDAPIETIINIVSHLCDFYDVVLCTGRRKSCENATRAWLDVNAPRLAKVPILFRNDGDKRHDTIVKPELLDKYIHDAQKPSGVNSATPYCRPQTETFRRATNVQIPDLLCPDADRQPGQSLRVGSPSRGAS